MLLLTTDSRDSILLNLKVLEQKSLLGNQLPTKLYATLNTFNTAIMI